MTVCRRGLWCCRSGLRLLSFSSAHRVEVNYYELLGVKPGATLSEIKDAFFDKSKKLHPDRDTSNPALHSQFVELNQAYQVLSRESSRKEYDFKLRTATPYAGGRTSGSTAHNNSTSSTPYTGSEKSEKNTRYWEQFRQAQAQEMTQEERQQNRRRDFRVVGYCLLTMLLSLGTHFLFYRKLEEVHSNFMDEKDRTITELYNQSKERAKVNGFKKQAEILRQKQAEFMEKIHMATRGGGGGK